MEISIDVSNLYKMLWLTTFIEVEYVMNIAWQIVK